MAIRPQCNKFVATYNAETAYGTAVADVNIDKMFRPAEPILPLPELERVNDEDFLKAHEWPEDANTDVIVAQDVSIPINFRASLEILGMLHSYALGNVAVSGLTPNFVHTMKVLDACTQDQLPSASWLLALSGDTASNLLVKGAIPNEIGMNVDSKKFITMNGTVLTDGTFTDKPAFTFPGSFVTEELLTGTMSDFLTADEGAGLVSQKSIFMGANYSLNNNLDVDDAKALIAATGIFLPELRFGKRTIELTIKLNAHQGGTFWDDHLAGTMKDAEFRLDKNANRYFSCRFTRCKITNIQPGFENLRDTLEVTYTPWFDTAISTPATIEIGNGTSAYLV